MPVPNQYVRRQRKLQTLVEQLCTEIYEGRPRVTILGRTRTSIDCVIKPRVLLALEFKGIQILQDNGDHIITGTGKVIYFRNLEDYQQILEQNPTSIAILD